MSRPGLRQGLGALAGLWALLLAAGCADAGQRIAFVSERDGNREVRLVDLRGRETRLTQTSADDYPAAVSPDGKALLVIAAEQGPAGARERLMLYPLGRGGEPRPVGPTSARARNPAWSPDGRWLVFEADTHSFRDLFRLDLAGGEPQRLTQNREGNFEPAVSPDGEWVAFVSSRDGDAEIYRMRADGSGVQRLTAFHTNDWNPRWSPGGEQIAFVSDREGEDRVFLVNADGTGVRQLSQAGPASGILEGNPAWSPDGRQIAYTVEPRTGRARVRITRVADGHTAEVAAGPRGGESDPAWSPDGRWLAFVSDRDGDAEIYIARPDGSGARRITHAPGADWLPRWVPG